MPVNDSPDLFQPKPRFLDGCFQDCQIHRIGTTFVGL